MAGKASIKGVSSDEEISAGAVYFVQDARIIPNDGSLYLLCGHYMLKLKVPFITIRMKNQLFVKFITIKRI